MAKIPFDQKQRILKEVYRHYIDFQDHASRTGQFYLTYGPITLSLIDLQYGLDKLSPRKREAVFLNVILDKKQKDAAAIMGITTVSVGQYVEQAMIQLAERYFAEMDEEQEKTYAELFLKEDDPDGDCRCECGKYHRVRYRGEICERCKTEVKRRKE